MHHASCLRGCNPCGFRLHICFEYVFGLKIFLLDVDSKYSRYLAAAAMNDTSILMYRSVVQQLRVGSQCLLHPFMALCFSKAEHPHYFEF